MARRSPSPRLVGRDDDLTDLVEATRSEDPERPVILVAGEAGIGKTRLLTELVGRIEQIDAAGTGDRTLVARGSCLRLAEGELPFAPILEVLGAIRGWGTSPTAAAAYDRLAGTGPDGARSVEARTQRFIEIHDALVAAAGDAHLLVIIDDLHWADRSTLDLVLFLARRLRGGRVTLIGAYRSDEIHRRHPLRPIVAELTRGYVRHRLDVRPLDRADVAVQIAALGGVATDDVIEAIADRADGNPFYVEELVALDPRTSGLPQSVRDVLLARLAALDEASLRVLGACAVIGREADVDLIRAVVEVDAQVVDAALRIAVDHWILVPEPNGRAYRFRHALLEEAVFDDLLPGDRVDLHRRVAAALEARDGEVTPGELARHLDQSGQAERAIEAYVEAASLAFRALAWAEGVAAFERAASLAAQRSVGDGPALRDLVRATANAMNWMGAPGRSIALLQEWIPRAETDGDAMAAAWMWLTLGRIQNDIGDEAASRAALVEALRLAPADDATLLGVDLLVAMSADAWIPGRNREALHLAERAVAGAERHGDREILFRALVHRGVAFISLGHVDRGMADIDRARRMQAEYGWLDVYGILATNTGSALAEVGDFGRALELWQEGLQMSTELGIAHAWGDPWNLPGLAVVAFSTGRWAEADAPIAAARAFEAPGMPTTYNEYISALLDAGRGDIEAAERSIDIGVAHARELIGEAHAMLRYARAAVADAADDPERRLAELEAADAALDGKDSFTFRSRLMAEMASAAADAIARLHPKRDRARIEELRAGARAAAERAEGIDAGRVIPGSKSVPWTRANVALAAAETARAEGRDDAAAWPPIAAAFADFGLRPGTAYATFRGAAAALAAGARDAAEVQLRAAYELASTIGMTVLARRIAALARAGRISLEADGPVSSRDEAIETADPWGLTGREREVLGLLAQGWTNGEIGAHLFISTKTASVHVTHILDKLGVSTRTEAALLASRAGILDAQLQSTK